jgi:hypothetical protein
MNRDTAVARWYRRIDPRCFTTRSASYTGEEVRQLIDPSNDDWTERGTTVLVTATAPANWLPLVDDRRRRTLGAIADRLPTLVALYRAGTSLNEMRDQFGGWSTWRYERALDIACDGIARSLNRGQLSG